MNDIAVYKWLVINALFVLRQQRYESMQDVVLTTHDWIDKWINK